MNLTTETVPSLLTAPARRAGVLLALLAGALVLGGVALQAQNETADADKAWAAVEKAMQPPAPPDEWRTKQPSPEEIAKFRDQQKQSIVTAVEAIADFQVKFPKDARAADARKKEYELLGYAVQMGLTNKADRLAALEVEVLKDPNLTDDERFEIRAMAAQRRAMMGNPKDNDAMAAAMTKAARELIKEFPKRDEPYQMLLQMAAESDTDEAKKIAQEIVDGSAPEGAKEAAKALLKKFDAIGKPLAIKFTGVDGREVDVANMKGKVVLVDFWATWCGPCVKELPNVMAAYEKLHGKGLEIVGISFDQNKDKLTQFVEKEKMPWPQYFDGKGWGNKFGKEYGINSIPAMWLVDKKGNLNDMNAREGLVAKVEKLLAE